MPIKKVIAGVLVSGLFASMGFLHVAHTATKAWIDNNSVLSKAVPPPYENYLILCTTLENYGLPAPQYKKAVLSQKHFAKISRSSHSDDGNTMPAINKIPSAINETAVAMND